MLIDNEKLSLPFRPWRKKLIDEAAFEAVMDTGNFHKATRLLIRLGYINTRTGKPYTQPGVYIAAHRYLVDNHEEVKPRLMKMWNSREDTHVSDEEWEMFVVEKAVTHLGNSSKGRFMKWLDKNPWAKKYDYLYARRFGLVPENS